MLKMKWVLNEHGRLTARWEKLAVAPMQPHAIAQPHFRTTEQPHSLRARPDHSVQAVGGTLLHTGDRRLQLVT